MTVGFKILAITWSKMLANQEATYAQNECSRDGNMTERMKERIKLEMSTLERNLGATWCNHRITIASAGIQLEFPREQSHEEETLQR